MLLVNSDQNDSRIKAIPLLTVCRIKCRNGIVDV